MKNNVITLGLVALAVGAVAPRSAKAGAAVTDTYQAGDLLVGFYNTSNEYYLDLGPISGFNLNTSFEIPESTTSMLGDLNAQFGTWYGASTGVYFGLVSDVGVGGSATIYLTDPSPNPAWSGAGTEGTPSTEISSMGSNYTANSDTPYSLGVDESSSTVNGWKYYAGNQATTGGFSGNFTDGGAQVGDGRINAVTTGTDVFDELIGTSNTEQTLGSWTVDSGGDLFYTAAVPEPSTWASIIIGAAALIGLRRRRS